MRCAACLRIPGPWKGPGRAPVEYSISPTLLHGHGHVVLSSSRWGAEAVMRAVLGGKAAPAVGDELVLRGPAIAAWLHLVREPFELARRLDEGQSAQDSKRFFDTLLAVVESIRELRLTAHSAPETTTLRLEVARVR